jgi:hypothetical protein
MALISALKITEANGTALATAFEFTEHSRSSIPLQYEHIETAERMANGTLRKFIVAKKINFSISWTDLPSLDAMTVDLKPGAAAIKDFYDTYYGQKLTATLTHFDTATTGAMTSETVYLFINSFSYDIKKRLATATTAGVPTAGYDYVDISIGFVEA